MVGSGGLPGRHKSVGGVMNYYSALVVSSEVFTNMSLLVITSVRKNADIGEDRKIGATIHRWVRKSHLCFIYTGTPVSTINLVLDEWE